MNILMVIPTFAPVVGGAERQLEGLAPALAALGHDITVATRRLPGTSSRDSSSAYVVRRLATWGLRFGFHVSLGLHLLFSGRRYDVIHCHTLSGTAVVCSLLGRLVHRPVILKVTRSGTGAQLGMWQVSGLRRLIFRAVLLKCTRLVAISEDTRSELAGLGVPPEKLACIPNGVAISPARVEAAALSIIYTGRLIPRKRVDLLLRAFAESSGSSDTRLTIAGDGPMREALEVLAVELGVQDRVVFTGELNHDGVCDELGKAAVFVLPSDSEGMSNSLLEAMAHGLAVIVADIEANREVVEQGTSGLLFRDRPSLSGHLDAVIRDAALRARLGGNAREVVSRRQSFATIAEQYEEVYRSLASLRRRKS